MVHAASVIPRLERLTDGSEDPVVLVVDFLPFSSAQRLGVVLAEHSAGRTIYQVDPVTELMTVSGYVSMPELATTYAAAFAERGHAGQRVVVVGHCSAAALAVLVTRELAEHCRATPLLVRPTRADTETVAAEFGRFRAALGATGQANPDPHADLDGAPAAALARMEAVLREDIMAMALAEGLDTASGTITELLARYRAWLGFLLAGHMADVPPAPTHAPVPVLIATDDEEDLSWIGADRTTRLPIRQAEFADEPAAVGEALARLVDRQAEPHEARDHSGV